VSKQAVLSSDRLDSSSLAFVVLLSSIEVREVQTFIKQIISGNHVVNASRLVVENKPNRPFEAKLDTESLFINVVLMAFVILEMGISHAK
jgi:hypothetical protein